MLKKAKEEAGDSESAPPSMAALDADKYMDLTCGFLTNFLSFGLFVFCTLLKL